MTTGAHYHSGSPVHDSRRVSFSFPHSGIVTLQQSHQHIPCSAAASKIEYCPQKQQSHLLTYGLQLSREASNKSPIDSGIRPRLAPVGSDRSQNARKKNFWTMRTLDGFQVRRRCYCNFRHPGSESWAYKGRMSQNSCPERSNLPAGGFYLPLTVLLPRRSLFLQSSQYHLARQGC